MSRALGLRRSVLGEKKQRGSKGWRGGWTDRFDIPKATSAYMMLTPGEYPDLRPEEVENNKG